MTTLEQAVPEQDHDPAGEHTGPPQPEHNDLTAGTGRTGKRGGQPGNQNARKHGFYSRRLDRAGRRDLKAADGMQGLDDEIAILRVKLRDLISEHPDRVDLHLAAARTIARLLKVNATLPGGRDKSLRAAMSRILTEVAIPAGITVLKH